jgi:hypothetical protein
MPMPTARYTRTNHATYRGRQAASFFSSLLLRFCGFAQKHAFNAFASSQKRHILRGGP